MATARTKKKPAKSAAKKPVKKAARKAAATKKKAPAARRAAAKRPAPRKAKPAVKRTPVARRATPVKKPVAPPPPVAAALRQAEIEGLISRLPPPVQPVVKALRQIVLEAAPEATEYLEQDSPTYAANGVFARIEPTERVVLVRFLRGAQLPSAAELERDGVSASLALQSLDALKAQVLQKLVREAVMLNLAARA